MELVVKTTLKETIKRFCRTNNPQWVKASSHIGSKLLLPRTYRLIDSLSGRATRACPPPKQLTGWASPATQSAAASSATKTGPSAPASAMSATPATQNEGGCEIVPRLPRKVPRRHPRLKRAQARQPVPWVPRLPRKTKVDVRLCHACHKKSKWTSPSATPATQSAAASSATKTGPSAPASAMSATPATQNEGGCEIVPRLPREIKVDVVIRD